MVGLDHVRGGQRRAGIYLLVERPGGRAGFGWLTELISSRRWASLRSSGMIKRLQRTAVAWDKPLISEPWVTRADIGRLSSVSRIGKFNLASSSSSVPSTTAHAYRAE